MKNVRLMASNIGERKPLGIAACREERRNVGPVLRPDMRNYAGVRKKVSDRTCEFGSRIQDLQEIALRMFALVVYRSAVVRPHYRPCFLQSQALAREAFTHSTLGNKASIHDVASDGIKHVLTGPIGTGDAAKPIFRFRDAVSIVACGDQKLDYILESGLGLAVRGSSYHRGDMGLA